MNALFTLPPVVLQTILGPLAIRLGRLTHFIRRQGKLRADAFARAFCLYLIRTPELSLERLASELSISASALCQRLHQRATARFLRRLLLQAVGQLHLPVTRRTVRPLLTRFRGVCLADCTTLNLPRCLFRRFPGCGGGARSGDRTAACKVLLRVDLATGRSTQLGLGSGRTPDVHLLDARTALSAGMLEITDLGFFDTDRFRTHNARGVWWLTRLPARINVRATSADPWQELAGWLRERPSRGLGGWDGRLEVAQISPLWMRVLVRPCPPHEAARRRRTLRARMKRHGRTPGWRQLVRCDWWVLGTNTTTDQLSPSQASELYRARWQIELVFKRWKSLGNVRVPVRLSANRAECELYGRLLGVLVVDWLALLRGGPLSGTSVWAAWQVVMAALGNIIRAIKGRIDWAVVMSELADDLKRLPKTPQRTRRPGTRQRLVKVGLIA